MKKGFDQHGTCDQFWSAFTLTEREYMSLIVSLNCMVAVTKMASVADSDFPLERKSFTYTRRQKKIFIKKKSLQASLSQIKLFPKGVNILMHFTHLIAKKLIKVPQLIGVGDFSVQRGVPLLGDPCGSTDLNGGVSA